MSDGFVEARIEDVTTGITVEVGQYGLAQRWVMIRGFKPPSIAPAKGTFSTSSDFLADLLVRGIRSLEEERIGTLSRGVSQGPLPEDWQDDDMGGRCGYGDD